MQKAETKAEYIVRAKASLRSALRAKSVPEKVEAVERLNEVSRKAKEAMRKRLTTGR